MTDDATKLAVTTREFVTAAVDLAVASACRQAGHMNFEALITGVMVGLINLMAAMGPEHLPALEDYLNRIGPVILDDVKMAMAAAGEQRPVHPMAVTTMQ